MPPPPILVQSVIVARSQLLSSHPNQAAHCACRVLKSPPAVHLSWRQHNYLLAIFIQLNKCDGWRLCNDKSSNITAVNPFTSILSGVLCLLHLGLNRADMQSVQPTQGSEFQPTELPMGQFSSCHLQEMAPVEVNKWL